MEYRQGALENMVTSPAFWRGRRVFVTGHTGFMGGWLVLALHRLGAEVHGYALEPPTTPSLFDLAGVGDVLASDTRGDIRDPARLTAALQNAKPDSVAHLAAQPLVLESYRAPVDTYAVNVLGTVHVLEAIRRTPSVAAVVVVTSDKCYANDGTGRVFSEGDPLGGADPYSSSKACAELVTAAYRASFIGAVPGKVPRLVATARAGNIIGGGDWGADRLVPDCVRAAAADTPVTLRHPRAIRPWQYVLDAVVGYLQLIEKMCGEGGARYATAWNFGPGAMDAVPVAALASHLMGILGGKVIMEECSDALPEAPILRLDTARAFNDLGWAPRWPIRRAADETAAWYGAWMAGGDMAAFTRAQIDQYMSP